MELRYFQRGFNFSQDGPGNRLVYHLQGCNLRCPWCSNPEGLALCGGHAVAVEALVDEALCSRMLFFDGGGVTLTGGEVCMQLDAAMEFLRALHGAGINTAIETNATSPRLPELFSVIDHLIMDCKHYDSRIHAERTGAPCDNVITNLLAALSAGMHPAIRIPLIGEFNASTEDAEGFCDLFDRLQIFGKATLELLRYHEFGREKYEALAMPYTMTEQAVVSDDCFRAIARVFQARGYDLIHT